MIDLVAKQKEVLENKKNAGLRVDSMSEEFCRVHAEVTEAFEAWLYKEDNLGEELADIIIYCMGIAELNGINLEDEITTKMENFKKRHYVKVGNGYKKMVKE